ncbi:hypothetical protein AC482_01980 [miscellaneous Crenarchaeota group-15 archaeon DG-45]|uniref:ArnR1-like winged helix-turn-helix domain-containing protein n=1 Tax=miscellaneous Crenarchaeota group-15 archaeon DG-45 TaxID=1685127 RepID=A0A0M0BS94_9ARCH|nr:MAG: hypothetical protein AC482_01980 [miscellaneous Crenarchaeota group-15 archaeon DG-45]
METKMVKILQVLSRASCYCPLGYISLHTNIIEPLQILEALEEEGYVVRCKCNDWSPSNYPQFMITPKARQSLGQIEADVFKIPKNFVVERLAEEAKD